MHIIVQKLFLINFVKAREGLKKNLKKLWGQRGSFSTFNFFPEASFDYHRSEERETDLGNQNVISPTEIHQEKFEAKNYITSEVSTISCICDIENLNTIVQCRMQVSEIKHETNAKKSKAIWNQKQIIDEFQNYKNIY